MPDQPSRARRSPVIPNAATNLSMQSDRAAHILAVQELRQKRQATRATVAHKSQQTHETNATTTPEAGVDRQSRSDQANPAARLSLDPPSVPAGIAHLRKCSLSDEVDPVQLQLKELIERSQPCRPDYAYYAVVTRLFWLATKGELAWRYLPAGLRKLELQDVNLIVQDEDCLGDARNMIEDCLSKLVETKALDVHLGNTDDDDTDINHDSDLRAAFGETEQALLLHVVEGVVFPSATRLTLLQQVRLALSSHIGYSKRLIILAYALVLWPSLSFDVGVEALQQFQADFRQHPADRATVPVTQRGAVDADSHYINGSLKPLATLAGSYGRVPKVLNTNAARNHLSRARRHVAPALDDIQYVERNIDWFKDRVYDAIVTLPSDADELQQKQWAGFEHSFAQKRFSLRTVEAKSFMVVEAALDLHAHGCRFNETVDWGTRPATIDLDNGMTCAERLNHLIKHLVNKSLCEDLLSNEQALMRIVIAPHAVLSAQRDKDRKRRAEKAAPQSEPSKATSVDVTAPAKGTKRRAADNDGVDGVGVVEEDSRTKKTKGGTWAPSTSITTDPSRAPPTAGNEEAHSTQEQDTSQDDDTLGTTAMQTPGTTERSSIAPQKDAIAARTLTTIGATHTITRAEFVALQTTSAESLRTATRVRVSRNLAETGDAPGFSGDGEEESDSEDEELDDEDEYVPGNGGASHFGRHRKSGWM
ncbi:hypothetical protein LTR85_008187 [Meristemomyces frigidus]|nr:hypothetical protein LTR85_008187 [Meristemomyces frigidus]